MEQHGQELLNRRKFLQRSALLGVGGLVAACGTSPFGGGSNTVTFWNLFGGGDGTHMVEMQQIYQKQHPEMDLRAVTLTWGVPYYTKVAMSIVGNSPPNVAIMHLSRMATYVDAGLLEPIAMAELARNGITEQDFLPQIWHRAQFKGTNYALPLDTIPFVMYYNTDICKKAGLLDASGALIPLQGPEAFVDAFKRVQKVTGHYGLSLAVADVTLWRLFTALYYQLGGGDIISPDGKSFVMNEAHAETALSFMSDLTLKSKVANPNIDYAGSVALFTNEQAGFLWDGEWEVTTYQGVIPFNMVPFPNIFGGNQTYGDSHSLIFPRGGTSDAQTRANTYQFASSLLKNSLIWAEGGHIPAYLPVTQTAEYKALKPQSNYAVDAVEVMLDPIAWFSGPGSQLEAAAQNAFSQALNGQKSVVAALEEFKSLIQKLLDQPIPLPTAK